MIFAGRVTLLTFREAKMHDPSGSALRQSQEKWRMVTSGLGGDHGWACDPLLWVAVPWLTAGRLFCSCGFSGVEPRGLVEVPDLRRHETSLGEACVRESHIYDMDCTGFRALAYSLLRLRGTYIRPQSEETRLQDMVRAICCVKICIVG